jgi:hypothetical protein
MLLRKLMQWLDTKDFTLIVFHCKSDPVSLLLNKATTERGLTVKLPLCLINKAPRHEHVWGVEVQLQPRYP